MVEVDLECGKLSQHGIPRDNDCGDSDYDLGGRLLQAVATGRPFRTRHRFGPRFVTSGTPCLEEGRRIFRTNGRIGVSRGIATA